MILGTRQPQKVINHLFDINVGSLHLTPRRAAWPALTMFGEALFQSSASSTVRSKLRYFRGVLKTYF